MTGEGGILTVIVDATVFGMKTRPDSNNVRLTDCLVSIASFYLAPYRL